MIDGMGMCGGCRVPIITNDIKFSCVDGPEFDGHIIDWDALINRNLAYKEEEDHVCHLQKIDLSI